MQVIDNRESGICDFCDKQTEEYCDGQMYLTQATYEGKLFSILDDLFIQRWYCDACSRNEIPISIKDSKDFLIKGNKNLSAKELSEIDDEKMVDTARSDNGCGPEDLVDTFEDITEYNVNSRIFNNPMYLSIDALLFYDILERNGIFIDEFIGPNASEVSEEVKSMFKQSKMARSFDSPYHQSIMHSESR